MYNLSGACWIHRWKGTTDIRNASQDYIHVWGELYDGISLLNENLRIHPRRLCYTSDGNSTQVNLSAI